MKLKLSIFVIAAFITSCGNDSKSPKTSPKKLNKAQKKLSCLKQYGLENSSLSEARATFSEDCKYMQIPESELVDHYKLRNTKSLTGGDCSNVESLLSSISKDRQALADLIAKKRAEASDRYDSEIQQLENNIAKTLNSPSLAEKKAEVLMIPVKKHKTLDLIHKMKSEGLSYSIDDKDLIQRKMMMKSFLGANFDFPVEDDKAFGLSTLHYCSLASAKYKEESYIEYQGHFDEQMYSMVFSPVLD